MINIVTYAKMLLKDIASIKCSGAFCELLKYMKEDRANLLKKSNDEVLSYLYEHLPKKHKVIDELKSRYIEYQEDLEDEGVAYIVYGCRVDEKGDLVDFQTYLVNREKDILPLAKKLLPIYATTKDESEISYYLEDFVEENYSLIASDFSIDTKQLYLPESRKKLVATALWDMDDHVDFYNKKSAIDWLKSNIAKIYYDSAWEDLEVDDKKQITQDANAIFKDKYADVDDYEFFVISSEIN